MKHIVFLIKEEFNDYLHVLYYLTNSKVHLDLKNYDEKMLFLILAIDPELEMLKIYNETNLQLRNETLRKTKMYKIISSIRERFGFYDSNLLKYEISFQRDYLCKNSLIPMYNKECKKDFIEKYKNISFTNITEEQYENIKKCIEYWEVNASNPKDINTLIYNIEQGRFNISTDEEKMLLFLMVFDPELNLLRIQEEESKIDNIIIRSNIEFGFYDENIFKLERNYHKRFIPDKKISDWSI